MMESKRGDRMRYSQGQAQEANQHAIKGQDSVNVPS